MLWRSFRDVKEGFYIDVGANDPVIDSVTNIFYQNGWSGINIEPNRQFFAKLQESRQRDINVLAAATSFNGEITFFEFDDTGLSTTEESLSLDHDKRGYKCSQVSVEALTLDTIIQPHVCGDVHFLKIDVEGGTKAVLEGLDLSVVRPWVILVEATKPMTQIDDFDEWEHLILSQKYDFVYADGLNRFYLALEHAELQERFKYPPNVFDEFTRCDLVHQVLARQASEAEAGLARERVAALEQDKAQLAETVRAQYARGDVAETRIAELAQVVAALEASLAERTAQAQAMGAHLDALQHEKAGLAQAVAGLEARAQAAEARLEQESDALKAALILGTQATTNTAQLMREKSAVDTTLVRTQERLLAAQSRLTELDHIRLRLQDSLAVQTEQARVQRARADHLETVLHRVAASLSWRITAPLRGWGKRDGSDKG